jgi:hypothetical protein
MWAETNADEEDVLTRYLFMPATGRHQQACNHGDYNRPVGWRDVELVSPPS